MRVRIYKLARELSMESKDLIDLCRQVGLDVKNQLSSIIGDQIELLAPKLRMTPSALMELCYPIDIDLDHAAATTPLKAPPTSAKQASPGLQREHKQAVSSSATAVLRSQVPPEVGDGKAAADTAMEWLCSLEKKLSIEGLKNLQGKDPEDAVKAMRKAAESVLRGIVNHPRLGFLDAIGQIESRISEKARALLHHIRSFGNIATHSQESFTQADVEHVAYALASVLEEFRQRHLLKDQ